MLFFFFLSICNVGDIVLPQPKLFGTTNPCRLKSHLNISLTGYPISLSNILLVIALVTFFFFNFLGLLIASNILFFVIAVKTTLLYCPSLNPSSLIMSLAIFSPSLSSSVDIKISFALLANSFISLVSMYYIFLILDA